MRWNIQTISKTRKYITVHSQTVQSPSKYHPANFNYDQKHDFQITHQTKQFSVMQQKFMKRNSKNQVIMSIYSTNQQIRIQKTK